VNRKQEISDAIQHHRNNHQALKVLSALQWAR
jgi:hypothetical protein